MKRVFLSGTPIAFRKKLYINSSKKVKSWILLGRTIDNLPQRVALKSIFGLWICLNFQNKYGQGIKAASIV
jgi:hypothetical protein